MFSRPKSQEQTALRNTLRNRPILQAVLHLRRQLKPHIAQTYLDSEDCSRFNITCGPLLDLGWEVDNGGDFLRLVTHDEMKAIDSAGAFDTIGDFHPDHREVMSNSCSVESFLYYFLDSGYQGQGLADRSGWVFRELERWEVSLISYLPADLKGEWNAHGLAGVGDGKLPHAKCVAVHCEKLEDDTLMFSEVWCVIMYTYLYFGYFPDLKRVVVPITVITISGTTYRIVQGFVDANTNSVRIRKSPVVVIPEAQKEIKSHMMLLLRWLLAEAVWPSWVTEDGGKCETEQPMTWDMPDRSRDQTAPPTSN